MTVDLCHSLRWKGYVGASWRTHEELAAALSTSDSPFSCLHTCRSWGPDDDLVAPESCTRDRPCFTPSPKTPRTLA